MSDSRGWRGHCHRRKQHPKSSGGLLSIPRTGQYRGNLRNSNGEDCNMPSQGKPYPGMEPRHMRPEQLGPSERNGDSEQRVAHTSVLRRYRCADR
ncbi:hypothetical protein NDU88_004955 [Pleurodeles waltl]|uniref:Uncharacterized protein n=1 Tax=Pleurodeles waltl TaxID=8319 RepID=A0AAV7TTZ1_PLEWA|nr:hypothetical protein NDU88_004955 [Pleurodeles waltl]